MAAVSLCIFNIYIFRVLLPEPKLLLELAGEQCKMIHLKPKIHGIFFFFFLATLPETIGKKKNIQSVEPIF